MNIKSKILLDSINEKTHDRLTTFEIHFPRFILPELNTHRMLAKNSSSSRARPVEKVIEDVLNNCAEPLHWGKNQPGMSAKEEIEEIEKAKKAWFAARDFATARARELLKLGIHKQVANRVLEPFMMHTTIVSGTEFNNFFMLRCHPDAQPEIKALADLMKEQYLKSIPLSLKPGDWHVPMILSEETFSSIEEKLAIATARCARVSYLTHDGKRDLAKDKELHERLKESKHWSPFEHCAQAIENSEQIGPFKGFKQYRKFFYGEDGRWPKVSV